MLLLLRLLLLLVLLLLLLVLQLVLLHAALVFHLHHVLVLHVHVLHLLRVRVVLWRVVPTTKYKQDGWPATPTHQRRQMFNTTTARNFSFVLGRTTTTTTPTAHSGRGYLPERNIQVTATHPCGGTGP